MAEEWHRLARALVGFSLLGFTVTGVIVLPDTHGYSDDLGGSRSQRPFAATAWASGGYLQYGIPGQLPMEQAIDGGGPVSEASGDSIGARNAFASLPYPGATFITVPGVANSFTGLPTPAYPFYVSASYPTQPEGKVSDPAGIYSLAATANTSSAVGEARFGSPGGQSAERSGSSAHSEVATTPEGVAAIATSLNEGVTMGPLSAAVVRSLSSTTYSGTGSPVTRSELVIEGGRVGDVTFSLAADGIRFGGAGAPVPVADGLARLNQAFAPSGLSARFLQPQPIPGGVIAGIFEVVSIADVPGAGKGTMKLRLGGALSAISLGDEPAQATVTAASGGDAGSNPGAGDTRSDIAKGAPASQSGSSATQTAAQFGTQPVVGKVHSSSGSAYGKTDASDLGLNAAPEAASGSDSAASSKEASAPTPESGAIPADGVKTLVPASAFSPVGDVAAARTLSVLLAGMGGLLGFLLLLSALRKRAPR